LGIRDRPTAPRSPWQNGHTERLIGSIRRECLDHVVVFGERHLRHLLLSYMTYYNGARTYLFPEQGCAGTAGFDETRLLILGAQVLFGFQFNGTFQEAFGDLQLPLRLIACAGLVMIMITIGLLIAPSMQHRIVERGEDSDRILSTTTTLAGLALFPLATALGLDVFMAIERTFGVGAGVARGRPFRLRSSRC
jgi:Family of unknown function (DUF6328)/Integrase core domain